MQTIMASIFVDTINTTALPMTVVLGGLIIFALWAGRTASRRLVLLPLMVSFSAFIVSRLLGPSVGSTAGFSLLNLLGYAGLACVIPRLSRNNCDDGEGPPRGPCRRLALQSGYMGLLGVVIFLVVGSPGRDTFGELMNGIIAFAAIGATIRLIAFVFHSARRSPTGMLPTIFAGLSLLSLSWLVLEVTPVLSESTRMAMLTTSRLMDIATMVLVLAGLMSDYVRVGNRFRKKSVQSQEETETARQELAKLSDLASNIYADSSDVIKKQKEQTLQFMKKVESVEKILQIGIEIQKRQRLDEVLKMIVEAVRDHVGFKTVTIRLLNEKTQNFETEAFVGLSDEVRDTVVNYRIPMSEYRKMIKPQHRVSKSYFIHQKDTSPVDAAGEPSMMLQDTWGDIDMLLVPLENEDKTIGYLSVENPENPKLSVADVIDTLENIAVLASIAIRNARSFKTLKDQNVKLSSHADKLSSLNKMKSNFVATVSHEFRTPLTSIKAYCETLLKNADEVDRELLKQFLIVIDEESSRLMTLIDDILDFSQLESGAMKFERRPSDLVAVIDRAAAEVDQNYAIKQVTLHREMPGELIMHLDAELIRQLIVNLLHNAAKFTKENGNVWLTVKDKVSTVEITVQDDGIGIPESQLGKVFEEFHQADNSNTRKHGGAGLGLAICKNVVEWHDGRIWVENLSGRGARFVAVIPKKEVVVNCHVTRVSSTVRRFEIERFLELLVENVAAFVHVRRASIMLVDKKTDMLHIECAIGLDEEIVGNASVRVGEGIAGRVVRNGTTLLVSDIETDERTERSNNELIYGSKAFLSVPIKVGAAVLGVINVASPLDRDQFTNEDALLLELLAERLAVALLKLQQFANASVDYESVRDAFKSILESKRYIDRKDDALVNEWVSITADKLGMSKEQKIRMRFIMNVYDLGLSKVGYHIVKKPHDLSPNEREEIEKHTVLGREMLAAIERTDDVGDVVMRHHENFDGTGYPGHIEGEAIPLEARIIRVSDSLRALISQRPYQRQYTLEEAKEVLQHRSGSFFDPKVVAAFIEAMEEAPHAFDHKGHVEEETHHN